MTKSTLSRDYLRKARARVKALHLLHEEEDYSDVVREAQEVVELCVKGMLRAVGIDPPRLHDVGKMLLDHADRFPPAVRKQLGAIAEISRELRKNRETAFYGEEDLIPSEQFAKADANRALRGAEKALRTAAAVIE